MIYIENNNRIAHWIVISKCIAYLNIGKDINVNPEKKETMAKHMDFELGDVDGMSD